MQKTDFPEYLTFLEIVGRGSLTRAAAQLGVTPSAVSQSLHKLESRLGVQLVVRTTRSAQPTAAGLKLAGKLEALFSGVDQAAQDTSCNAGKASGVLRITISAVAAEVLVAPHIAEFRREHPEIKVNISVSDRLVDIVEERFDAGIRRGDMLQGDMVSECLSPDIQMLAAASPGYMKGRSCPTAPKDFREHACIRICSKGRGSIRPWRFTHGRTKVDLKVRETVLTDTVTFARDAALNDAGVAFLSSDYLKPHLTSGRLVPLLPEWATPRPGFYLYHPSQRYVSAAVRLFAIFLRSKVLTELH